VQLSDDGHTLIKVNPADIPSDGHFNVPSTVNEIKSAAFFGCTRLTEVTFPEGLTKIGSLAFSNCKELAEVTFPEGLTEICVLAFQGCTGLQVMIINTQSDVELNRFKALLIKDLQDKVIDKARYEALSLQAKAFRPEALEPLCRIAEINPLLMAVAFQRKDNG
jgi:hypothetical protein